MSCFIKFEDEEVVDDRLNIDDLYEKKHRQSLRQLSIFNTILQRIHKQIKQTARISSTQKYVWFITPEFLFGQPLYNQSDCIAYIVHKLETNGFTTRYVHPNALYISWAQWVPYYVREEYKRKTGLSINEHGNTIEKHPQTETTNNNSAANSDKVETNTVRFANAKAFRPPTMIYDENLMDTVSSSFSR